MKQIGMRDNPQPKVLKKVKKKKKFKSWPSVFSQLLSLTIKKNFLIIFI